MEIKFKKIIKYLLKFLLIVLITLFIIELLGPFFKNYFPYKFLPQKIIINFFDKSNITEFTLKKNFVGNHLMSEANINVTVTSNEFNQRVTNNNKNGKEKIYVFGDSFTFGYGVEDHETIPFYLQNYNPSFSFENLGFSSGRDISSYYTWLKHNIKNKNVRKAIIIFYTNDLADLREKRCFDSQEKEVSLTDINCINIKSNYIVFNGKLFEKSSYLLKKIFPYHHILKRSYSIALVRIYYDYIMNYKNSKNKKEGSKILKKEILSEEEKDSINFFINYFHNNINLAGLVLIDYNDNNLFYNYIIKLTEDLNIRTVKINPLHAKYKIGKNDIHYNNLGNQFIADIINNELFSQK